MSNFIDFVENTRQSFDNVKKSFQKVRYDYSNVAKTLTFKQNNLPIFDRTGNLLDSKYSISDKYIGPDILWSSEKIYSLIPKSGTSSSFVGKENNIATFNNQNNIKDSGFVIDDNSAPNAKVLYSSLKNDQLLNNLKTQLANAGTTKIDDAATNTSTVWSSSKTQNTLNAKVSGTKYLAEFVNGNVKDSPILSKDVMLKKVPSNVKNFTTLDTSGQVQDSQTRLDDLAAQANNILWSSAKISSLLSSTNTSSIYLDYQRTNSGNSMFGPFTHRFEFNVPRSGKLVFFGYGECSNPDKNLTVYVSLKINGVFYDTYGVQYNHGFSIPFTIFGTKDIPAGKLTMDIEGSFAEMTQPKMLIMVI